MKAGWNIILLVLFVVVAGAKAQELSDWVDPMLGVPKGKGSCVPGPCLPHSSIYPSPETTNGGTAGYLPAQGVVGFAQLHAQGTGGTPSYGNFLVSPQVGLQIAESAHASLTTEEVARCYYYKTRLAAYNILCEVTPSHHSALYRFTFPASTNASIVIDVARKIGQAVALNSGSVTIDPGSGLISGGGKFSGNWNPAPYSLYFSAQLSRAPSSVGIWQGTQIQTGSTNASVTNKDLGVFAQFQTQSNDVIYLKLAVSFKSQAQANAWLEQEIPAWDFAGLQATAQAAWDQALSVIQIEGESDGEPRRFYSHLYHAMTQPRDRTGDNGNWVSTAPFYDDHYALWDTWKTLFPLMAIVDPQMIADNVNSFIDRHNHNGYVATAFTQGKEYIVGQGGDEVDNIIADAYVKGIPGIDWEQAYAVQHYNAESRRTPDYTNLGYVSVNGTNAYPDGRMHSGSGTLAFAYNDYCVAQVAKGLGKAEDYNRFLQRSQNWTNVWDSTLHDGGFSGFIRGRYESGQFTTVPATGGFNTDFYEGTCWIYSYMVPHDVPGLIQRMGGTQTFIQRLTYALNNNLISFGNEPSFMTIWWFDAVNRPDLASQWANQVRNLYPDQGCPGDDDSGAMGSLYVFLDAGIFPIAGQDLYYLHGPRVGKMSFHLSNGKTFTIIGRHASAENIFIQSVTLNGKCLQTPSIRHKDIVDGGTLEFTMGLKPSAWGR